MPGPNRWSLLLALALGIVIGMAAVARPVVSQEAGDAPAPEGDDYRQKPPTPEEMAAAMKQWEETTKPGKYHRFLERMVGEWDTTMTMTMMPGSPPTKGTARTEWAFDGKWIQWHDEGVMMGKPISSTGFMGYDNFKKKFVGASISSGSTALLTYDGALDRTGTELRMWGPMDEPMTGEHDKPVRYHWKFDGPDKFVIEVHDLFIGGDDTKVFEIAYVRKKGE